MDASGVQDKIDLTMGGMAGMGRRSFSVGIFESGCGKKQLKLPAAPKCVEIASEDYLLAGILYQAVELLELILSVSVLEGEMDDKNHDVLEFRLDDQPFDAL